MAMITLKHVSKHYHLGDETVYALDEVDFTVEQGEFVSIVGPSGSGKSTLMNIIGLLDTPDTGSYDLNGADVYRLSDNQLAQLRNEKIGFVFQNFNLLSTMTAFENVKLPLLYRGVSDKLASRIADGFFERFGLTERKKHLPSQLSGGQQQRVAIARALIGSPEIILADEPTGALDSRTSNEIMDLLAELNREGLTIILITHNPDLALKARRIVSIVDGRLFEEVSASHENHSNLKRIYLEHIGE